MPMVLSTKDNFMQDISMVKAYLHLQMGLYPTKADGSLANHRFKGQSNIQMDLTPVGF